MTHHIRPKIVCLADDLTGANVTASLLRAAGLSHVTVINTSSLDCPSAGGDAVAVNLDNRDLDEQRAIKVLIGAIRTLIGLHAQREIRWAIRIDSTLRGHVGPTLAAIKSVLAPDSLLVAPAFPTAGRLTVNGIQQIPAEVASRGQFLSKERDLLRILDAAGYETQLLNGSDVPPAPNETKGVRAIVGDATTQQDLALLAKGLLPLWTENAVVVDSGPFLAALVREKRGQYTDWASSPLPPDLDNSMPTVIVVGSRAETTRRQLEYLSSSELKVLYLDAGDEYPERALDSIPLRSADALVISSRNESSPIDGELERVGDLATRIISLLGGSPPLIISGGRTARVLFEKLGVHVLEAGGELLPLIPLSTIKHGRLDGSLVVTKGGLVGSDDTLLNVLKVVKVLREGMTR